MKRIRKSRAARLVSWLLTFAMITTIAAGAFRPTLATAQGTGTGVAQDVAVLRFENKAGNLGAALAKLATDQVSNELSASGKFTPLPEQTVEAEIRKNLLRPPFDSVAISRLSAALNINTVITGEIAFVRVTAPKGAAKEVQVGLRVRVIEGATGDLLNGASQVGVARARPGLADEDQLIQEAAQNAAVQSVKQILSYTLPSAAVIGTIGTKPNVQVVVNRGSRDGMQPGMRLIATRDRQRVAEIELTQVFPAMSEARIISDPLGVRIEDKLRAVFPMPPFPAGAGVGTQPTRTSAKSGMNSLGKILTVLVIGAAIATAVGGGSSSSVTNVTAEADQDLGAAAVRLTWRDNIWGAGTFEYQVWRDRDAPYNLTGTPVAALNGGQRTYTDHPAPSTFWGGGRSFHQPPRNTGDNNNNQGGLSTVVTPDPADADTPRGFVTGLTYRYLLSAVIQRQFINNNNNNQGGNQGVTFEDVGTDPVPSGPVTPVNPVQLASPADGVGSIDITRFDPRWLSTTGADEYQVEVSTDGTFRNKQLILQLPLKQFASPPPNGVQQRLDTVVNLSNNPVLRRDAAFRNWEDGAAGAIRPTIFWRVGARNRQDRPGPVDAMTRNAKSGDMAFRFVYSQPRSFQPADAPPPPP